MVRQINSFKQSNKTVGSTHTGSSSVLVSSKQKSNQGGFMKAFIKIITKVLKFIFSLFKTGKGGEIALAAL